MKRGTGFSASSAVWCRSTSVAREHAETLLQLRRFANAMEVPPETFGLLNSPSGDRLDRSDDLAEWSLVRQTLNRNRHALTTVAARLYWDPVRIEGTSCITRPGLDGRDARRSRCCSARLGLRCLRTFAERQRGRNRAFPTERPDGPRFERYSQVVRPSHNLPFSRIGRRTGCSMPASANRTAE